MATFTNQSKNSSSYSNVSKNTSSYSNQDVSLVGATTATAGLYYGFGAFTYSGGEILVAGSRPTYTNQTKN